MSLSFLKWQKYFNWIKKIPLILSSLALFILIYEFGFESSFIDGEIVSHIYILTIVVGIIFIISRYFNSETRPRLTLLFIDFLLVAFLIFQVLNLLKVLENY